MNIHFDRHGLITEQDGNGGDSANRMGLWVWLFWMQQKTFANDEPTKLFADVKAEFIHAVSILEPHPFVFIRHPDSAADANDKDSRDFAKWNDWNNFSRDQWLPLVTGIGLTDGDKFRRIISTTLKRHGTLSNGDVLGPSHWAHIYRLARRQQRISLGKKLYLYFADSFGFLGFFLGSFKRGTSDTLVGFMLLLTAYKIHPTLVSKFTLWFVKWFGRYPKKWEIYFGHPNGAQLHHLAKPLFDKYL
ncbi:MAG: hypothetical protein ACXABY_06985 [Candidatus Thorarchaeota archaeon]|jgi:hypothetical protein